MATKSTPKATAKPEFDTEVANRLRDPYENNYMGVLRSNDPLLLERGGGSGLAFEMYRDLKRDGKVASGLQRRKLAVIGKPWQVEAIEKGAAADTAVEVVTQMLKGINFDKLCSQLLDALLVGFAPAEIVWTLGDSNTKIMPARIVKRAQRRFVYVQDDENAPPALHLLTKSNMLTGELVPDRKFIVHCVEPEDDNPYGTGLGLQLYWPVFFKRKGILSWNKLNDRFGSPTPWGKYPKGAGPKEKGTLFDALKAMSNDGVIMTPEGMSLELLESKLTGSITTQQSLCEYMDDWIMEVILGQSPRGKGGGAMAAASNEREDVRVELSQADSDLLSETINSTLLAWFCDYNGLSPCRVYRVIKKDEDLKAASETDKNVAGMGFKLTLPAVITKYGEGWEEAAPPPAPPPEPAALPPSPSPGEPAPGVKVDAKPASFAESDLPGDPDPIDALVAAELAQWQPMVDPIAKVLQAALDESATKGETAAQFIARMPELLSQFDADALSQALTRSAFTARLAGVAGVGQV